MLLNCGSFEHLLASEELYWDSLSADLALTIHHDELLVLIFETVRNVNHVVFIDGWVALAFN